MSEIDPAMSNRRIAPPERYVARAMVAVLLFSPYAYQWYPKKAPLIVKIRSMR